MDPSTRVNEYAGFTALEWEFANDLNDSYNGVVWTCRNCGHTEDGSIKLMGHMLEMECGDYSIRAGIDELHYDLGARLAVLAAVDWKTYQRTIESYVSMWEVCRKNTLTCLCSFVLFEYESLLKYIFSNGEGNLKTAMRTAAEVIIPNLNKAQAVTARQRTANQ